MNLKLWKCHQLLGWCLSLPEKSNSPSSSMDTWPLNQSLHQDVFSKDLLLWIVVLTVFELEFYVFWRLRHCWHQWRKTCFLFCLAKLIKGWLFLFVWPCKYWHEGVCTKTAVSLAEGQSRGNLVKAAKGNSSVVWVVVIYDNRLERSIFSTNVNVSYDSFAHWGKKIGFTV